MSGDWRRGDGHGSAVGTDAGDGHCVADCTDVVNGSDIPDGAPHDHQRAKWEARFAGLRGAARDGRYEERLAKDDWLEPWLPILQVRGDAANFAQGPGTGGIAELALPILDLGCGSGADSRALTRRGFRVIACDYAESALALVSAACPGIETMLVDLRETLPFADGSASAAIADLSLHYFDSATTARILGEIRRVLVDGGLFLARFNSVRDIHHGAGLGTALEENYFLHEGRRKRFFDAPMIERLVAPGWEVLALAEKTTSRFAEDKALWEFVGRKPR